MRASRRSISSISILLLALGLVAVGVPRAGAEASACPGPAEPLTFSKQTYVDETRAGGEPSVATHPDGTLLYGAHAGTTHFYSPAAADANTAAFFQNYRNQAYYWWSDNNGKTWQYADRLPPGNMPGSGFSDPDLAIDKAGQVYISEINLVNVAVSRSTDSGRTYQLQNFFAQTMTDRQWKAADEKDVVYIVGNAIAGGTFPTDPVGNSGHQLYKSTDGGRTFSAAIDDAGGLGDLQVDHRNGTLYEAHLGDATLTMRAFRGARKDDFKPDDNVIAKGVDMLSHWPALDVDSEGNVYIVWDETGRGDRPGGVWYSYSTDAGNTWAAPLRVDLNDRTDLWPWLQVGAKGKVAIAWLEADEKLPGNDAEVQGDHGWRIMMAQSLNGLGCSDSDVAGFRVSLATPEPVHQGTICNSGTVCQAQGIDRRMGDYFSIDIDRTGRVWAGFSDTRQGGAVALPGFVRQSGGPTFGRGVTS